MINSWREDTRTTGKLRIAEKAGFKRAPWKGLLSRAIKEFNALSKTYDLLVTFVEDSQPGQANVTVDTVAGSNLVGHAPFQSFVPEGRPDSDGRVFRCDITLPSDPKVNTPQGQRRVGSGVLLVMLVHEMVHACGLSNEEHSKTTDLFLASPSILIGDRQAEDSVDSRRTAADKTRIGMPPLLLDDNTAESIRKSWRGPVAALPVLATPIGAGRVASAQRGPAGLVAGSITLAASRRPGPLSVRAGATRVLQVWG